MNSRPVLAALLTFTFAGVFYIASHTISEARAAAQALLPEQHAKPNHEKTVTPPAQPMRQWHMKAETTQKAESAMKDPASEHVSDPARRKELCRKLEQRRAELREEREAAKAKEAQE